MFMKGLIGFYTIYLLLTGLSILVNRRRLSGLGRTASFCFAAGVVVGGLAPFAVRIIGIWYTLASCAAIAIVIAALLAKSKKETDVKQLPQFFSHASGSEETAATVQEEPVIQVDVSANLAEELVTSMDPAADENLSPTQEENMESAETDNSEFLLASDELLSDFRVEQEIKLPIRQEESPADVEDEIIYYFEDDEGGTAGPASRSYEQKDDVFPYTLTEEDEELENGRIVEEQPQMTGVDQPEEEWRFIDYDEGETSSPTAKSSK